MEMIRCEGLVKIFKTDDVEVVALQGLNLTVQQGELMAIIGSSGSGKSTLLNILGGLDRPSAGQAQVGPWNLLTMTKRQLIAYKRETVGFVWQNNGRNLVPYLTALQNVELPMLIRGKVDRAYAKQLLAAVGLEQRMGSRLAQLSGGEQQRVAIAIALAGRPALLLADEPTGSVDSATGDQIFDIFRRLSEEMGVTIVIVTHDLAVADRVDRVVAIRDGLTSTEWIKRDRVRVARADLDDQGPAAGGANVLGSGEAAGGEGGVGVAVGHGTGIGTEAEVEAEAESAAAGVGSGAAAFSGTGLGTGAIAGFGGSLASEPGAAHAQPTSRFGARHEQYVVIDRVGRLQIPQAYLDSMNVSGKAVMSFDGKRVTIGPPGSATDGEGRE